MEAAARGVDIWNTLIYLTSDQRKITVGWMNGSASGGLARKLGKMVENPCTQIPLGSEAGVLIFLCVRVLIIQNSLY